MCGLVGYWSNTNRLSLSVAERMASQIKSRGPDDSGIWGDDASGLVLAHRRLSIVDLSSAGHQPMLSPCRRYVIVYNGEIYNHKELRANLERNGGGFDWRGHSDTETLLAAIRHWGLQGALNRINGMFAFAVWDAEDKTLFLARDRLGEKPLYYGRIGDCFLFGSQLKALTAHPYWRGDVDRNALALYMRHNYVPSPWSIYRGIYKLPPAHFLAIRDGGCEVGEPICYWDMGLVAEQGSTADVRGPEALTDDLDSLLRDAVKRRMVADVPLGAFLSGGYDSTTVAALMQAQSEQPVKTFSIGFFDDSYNEAPHAKVVAQHLGTEHTELYVTPEEAIAVIPKLPAIYDEPFSDSSQIPTYLVSELARRHVTVSLSGDGGDELFCGYNRYVTGYGAWNKFRRLPTPLRRLLASAIRHAPGHALDAIQRRLPRRLQVSNLADRLPKLAQVLEHQDGLSFYRSLVSHINNPRDLVLGADVPGTILDYPERLPALPGLREKMMYLDMMTYLPDDILAKVDRASMAVSLEARVPLLDHRIVEFAWRVPMKYKCRSGHGKWLLRQVLYRYVPQELMDKPKKGFGVPIEHWLRGPLRDWAESLLDTKRLREQAYLDPLAVRRIWEDHLNGKGRWHYCLWDVLMFQAWLDSSLAVQ